MDALVEHKTNQLTHLTEKLFEDIYNTYSKNVYNYIAYRISNHHDAEELMQSVFEKLITTWKPNKKIISIEAWLITIAKNITTDYYRKKRLTHPIESLTNLISKEKNPEDIAVINENNKQLVKALSKLKNKERQIIAMKYATNLKQTDIAYILGITPENVRAISSRAIKKLEKIIKEIENHG